MTYTLYTNGWKKNNNDSCFDLLNTFHLFKIFHVNSIKSQEYFQHNSETMKITPYLVINFLIQEFYAFSEFTFPRNALTQIS